MNLYLVVLVPGAWPADPAALARRAARVLEERNGLLLDWAAGFRSSGAVWLLIKPWARDRGTMKRVRYRPSKDDLEALRSLVGKKQKARARER